MRKHKNFINLQLYAPPPITTTWNIYVNGATTGITVGNESSSFGTWIGEQEFNTTKYTISGNTVLWSDGTILQYNGEDVLPTDTIVSNGQYTTRAATPTLTFKHFYDAGTIGSGTYKFRHYSQQEPSSGETWVLNETLNNQSYGIESITFSSNNTTYTKFARYYKTDMLGEVEQDYVAFYTSDTNYITVYDKGTWTDAAYRTITFAEPVTDSTLLAWLQTNGVKQ